LKFLGIHHRGPDSFRSTIARLKFWRTPAENFQFLDPGSLIDGDFQLVQPHRRWINAVLAACKHPAHPPTQARLIAETNYHQLRDFVKAFPQGHQRPNSAGGIVPTYHFWMCLPDRLDFPIVGSISLRIGLTQNMVMFNGQVGYQVYPFARGNHYAERACRMLLPLAARHGLDPLWITCNPDNFPSRRTCERLGANLVETVDVPPENPLYQRGERAKCRYRINLGAKARQ
jgi:predicted acetyltransferase